MAAETTVKGAQKFLLKSSDGQEFEVDEIVALQSQTIKTNIKDNVIPLPDVTGMILSKVVEYCTKHVEFITSRADDEEIKAWDCEFVKVDLNTLFDLVKAAHHLKIKSLLDLTCGTVADMIRGKTPEEIRKTFIINNEFTLEEEEEVRRENQWAFE